MAVLAALIATACARSVPPPTASWTAVELITVEGKLGGCAIGDLEADRPGLEAVVVSSEGQVVLVGRTAEGWESEVLLQAPGELIQVATGDLLPQFPGDEILAGGMLAGGEKAGGDGALYVLWREGGAWRSVRIASPRALVHAVAVLDFDPDRPGLEAVAAGFDLEVRSFSFGSWPAVAERFVGTLPAPAKGMVPCGSKVAIACEDGSLILQGTGGGRSIFRGTSGLARLGFDAGELLVSSNAGELYRLAGLEGQALPLDADVVFVEPGGVKGRGAVVADLEPARAGLEYATAGYSGKVHLPYRTHSGYAAIEIYDDGQPLHHLAAGEFVVESPGLELLCCGFGGRLVLLQQRP